MDWPKLIGIATALDVPGLAERGIRIAKDMAAFVAMVRANAVRAGVVLSGGDTAMLDAIHAEALAAADALDVTLAEAEKR